MKCVMCKGKMEDKLTNFVADFDNCIIIVKNVPSQVCSQCGEVTYTYEIAKKLEKIVNDVRFVVSDVAIVNYQDKIA